MNGIAQPQAQAVPRLPRDAVNEPRRGIIIDLTRVSDDEDSEADEDSYDEAEEYADALEEPIQPQGPVLAQQEQRQAGARPNFVGAEMEPFQFDAFMPARQPSPLPRRNEIWGDYIIDDDFDAEEFARVIDLEQDFPFQAQAPAAPPAAPHPQAASLVIDPAQQEPQPAVIAENQDECVQSVAGVFPGICLDHVLDLYHKIAKSSGRLIAHILDQMDKGILYPKARDKAKDLKRKRDVDEDEEAARKYGALDRIVPAQVGGIRPYVRNILSHEFSQMPMAYIDASLSQSGHRLFSAYQLLDEANRTYNPLTSGFQKIKNPRKQHTDFREENIEILLKDPAGDLERAEVLRELRAARRVKAKAEARRQAELVAQLKEEENKAKAKAEGTMSECGCCFDEYPLNRMVHCDGEPMHWFCRACALRNAENEVGQSKYELCCMSMDECNARFTISQRDQFLDEKTKIALERNEQEANLRLAGIENLASCPFCPYAAEYPPVEVDREFRCQAPDCEKVSCRLCNLESHIPKSCEENAKETGLSVRRQVEEAMSAALIRKCNKCGTPFIKEEGCNKMRCTLKGCGNVQCYVCSKSCDYDHFNDEGRGGKRGNCPLFESVETRHDQEVGKAEKEALDKIRAEHPEYTEDDLKIKVSEDVKKDDQRRRARDPRINIALAGGPLGARGVPIQAMRGIYEFLPINRAARQPPRRAAAGDPALPVYPGPPAYHHHHHHHHHHDVHGRYGRPAEPPGNANALDPMRDVYFNDFEMFNNMFGDDLQPPLGPFPGAPPIPDRLAVPAAAYAQPRNDPPFGFQDLVMRYPQNTQPAAQQAVDAQGENREGFAGGPLEIFPEEPGPLPDWRALADNQQAENQSMVLDAIQGRMARRMKPKAQAVNEALRQDDILKPPVFQARAEQRAAERAELEAEMVLPNFKYPVARRPPARNNNPPGAGDKAAIGKVAGQAQENGAERRRQFNEQADRMFFHLDDYGAERRRFVDERIVKLRAAAQEHEGEGRRQAPENLDLRQIRARDRDEELHAMNVRLDRLKAEVKQANAVEPVGGRNDAGGERSVKDEFGRIFAHMVPDEPIRGNNGEPRQREGRVWSRFGIRQDPPAAALRQQQILDHEEWNIQRSQQMARPRRAQENDGAATARRLEPFRPENIAMRPAHPAVILSDSPEPEDLSTGDEADEADDEDDFEPEIWF